MMRLAATVLLAALGSAPVQCAHKPDPDVRREDGPDDALWGLAQDFRARGDEASAQATLRYLAQRYPGSRHALEAKSEVSGDAGASK